MKRFPESTHDGHGEEVGCTPGDIRIKAVVRIGSVTRHEDNCVICDTLSERVRRVAGKGIVVLEPISWNPQQRPSRLKHAWVVFDRSLKVCADGRAINARDEFEEWIDIFLKIRSHKTRENVIFSIHRSLVIAENAGQEQTLDGGDVPVERLVFTEHVQQVCDTTGDRISCKRRAIDGVLGPVKGVNADVLGFRHIEACTEVRTCNIDPNDILKAVGRECIQQIKRWATMRTDVTKATVCMCPLDTEAVTECCLLVRDVPSI